MFLTHRLLQNANDNLVQIIEEDIGVRLKIINGERLEVLNYVKTHI